LVNGRLLFLRDENKYRQSERYGNEKMKSNYVMPLTLLFALSLAIFEKACFTKYRCNSAEGEGFSQRDSFGRTPGDSESL
jgi:hypothetical protein